MTWFMWHSTADGVTESLVDFSDETDGGNVVDADS